MSCRRYCLRSSAPRRLPATIGALDTKTRLPWGLTATSQPQPETLSGYSASAETSSGFGRNPSGGTHLAPHFPAPKASSASRVRASSLTLSSAACWSKRTR